jgi:protein-S-isoprenylcysteine O-methyltransferase Ste14
MISTTLLMPTLFRAAIVAAMVIYFSAAAMWEERKFERSAIATEYARYKQRTGRFVPKLDAKDAEREAPQDTKR